MMMTFFHASLTTAIMIKMRRESNPPTFPQSWCVLPWQPSEVVKTGGRPWAWNMLFSKLYSFILVTLKTGFCPCRWTFLFEDGHSTWFRWQQWWRWWGKCLYTWVKEEDGFGDRRGKGLMHHQTSSKRRRIARLFVLCDTYTTCNSTLGDTYNTCNTTFGDTYNTCNTHHQTNRKKTMSAENIVCSKQSHFTLTRCPRIVVAWNCLCQCLQRLS